MQKFIRLLAKRLYNPYRKYSKSDDLVSFETFKSSILTERKAEPTSDWVDPFCIRQFYFSCANIEELQRQFFLLFSDAGKEEVLNDAVTVMNHEFNLLGTSVKFENEINWRTDFRSGYEWGMEVPSKLLVFEYPDNSDIKYVWELSRFQHLIPLGKAYVLTGDERYPREFIQQIESWIEDNPVGFGPNWVSAMEVAIRAVNWICAYQFFSRCSSIEQGFWHKFLYMLYIHGHQIMNNLETRRNKYGFFVNNNHFMANLCGLIFLGLLFQGNDSGKQWLRFGLRHLAKEIKRQVTVDGCDFESSISYHRLVLEMVSYTLILLKINGFSFPDRIWKRLRAMLEFVVSYVNEKGMAPQIGDADDGRFLIFGRYSTWSRQDHSYLLDLGRYLYGGKVPQEESTFWVTHNCPPLDKYSCLEENKRSKSFPLSGFYVLKNNHSHMVLSAGPSGSGKRGNHKHNDTFSFCLSRNGQNLLVDPGTYSYSGDRAMRNVLRSTRSHNTLQVGDYEINPFDPAVLFRMEDYARPIVTKWKTDDAYDLFIGCHRGFSQRKIKAKHERTFLFNKKHDYLLIRDQLKVKGSQPITDPVYIRFHLSQESSIDEGQSVVGLPDKVREDMERIGLRGYMNPIIDLAVHVRYPDGQHLYIVPFFGKHLIAVKSIESTFVSPSYGVKLPSKKVVYAVTMGETKINYQTCILIMATDSAFSNDRGFKANRAKWLTEHL